MSLLPEFQKHIDEAFNKLELTDDRRKVLQPELEKYIKGYRNTDETKLGYHIDIVDDDGNKRDGVKLSDLVCEIHKKVSDDSIPLVENKNLSEDQLQKIAAGKLKLKKETKKIDPEALSDVEAIEKRVPLEDISSGKVKINITR